MKRSELTNQGGSVVTFVVVGIVLTAFVMGGVYMLQKRSQDSSKTGPVAVNTKSPSPSPSVSKSPVSTPKPTTTPTPSVSKKPSPSPSVTPSPKPSSTPKATPPVVKNAPSTEKLPVTGPEEDFIGGLMLAIFIGMTAAFLRSYRVRYGYQTE